MSMVIAEFLSSIHMPDEAAEAILDAGSKSEVKEILSSDDFERLCFYPTAEEAGKHIRERLSGKDGRGFSELFIHCAAAVRNRNEGCWKSFDGDIFTATFGCFSRFVNESLVSYGYYAFDRGFWTIRQIGAVLFRLGALEYEICRDEKRVQIHIPSDADLRRNSISASLAMEMEFMKNHFPEVCGWTHSCGSWLLSPALPELLPETSNILAFQRRFSLTKTDPEARDYLQWVYKFADPDRSSINLNELPENTSLQKRMKEFVLAGGRVGVGYGDLTDRK